MADLQHEYEHLTKPIVILPQASSGLLNNSPCGRPRSMR
jgi:hypothetical protein